MNLMKLINNRQRTDGVQIVLIPWWEEERGLNWTIFSVDIMHICISHHNVEAFGYQRLYVTSRHVFNVLCTGG